MKRVADSRTYHANDAWGRDVLQTEDRFEVEQSDVGVTRQNYLGWGHSDYTFTQDDVGRVIVNYRAGHWSNWVFALNSKPVP